MDIGCEETAIGQLRAWEDRVVVDIANLLKWQAASETLLLKLPKMGFKLTLAKSIEGRPPAPKKTFMNATGNASMESS